MSHRSSLMTSKLRFFAPLLFFIAVSAAAEEEKRADEMPVLTAKSVVVTPAYPRPEEPAEVVLTIENSANAAAEDVEVVIYANGETLASQTVTIGTLGVATVSVPWMAKSAGKTTLVARVGPRQLLTERDRYDNTYVLDVVTSVAPAVEADFAVTAVDVLAPAESSGSIRVAVANEGTVYVRTIAIDRNYPLTVYAGTDRGVFQGRSTTHGLTWFWRPYDNGMPRADVRDLEVHPVTGIMRAFTHGRSAYEVTTSKWTGDVVASKRAPKPSVSGQ